MNKLELTREVAQITNLSMDQSMSAVDAVLEAITNVVTKGDTLTLVGFGTFSIAQRKARNGRNPSTGETMLIPAKKVVKFKPGSKMKLD